MILKFSQLLIELGIDLSQANLSNGDPEICNLAALGDARPGDLGFLENSKFFHQIKTTQASALLVPDHPQVQEILQQRQIAYAAIAQPRLYFARAIAKFYPQPSPDPGIHPTAAIAADVQLGADVYVGAQVVIESGCQIGDRVQIYGNVTIYPQVTVGAGTVLHANCVIHPRTVIGQDC
ncbi:MAG: LpxD N-terminal domain-containing protein, partial [Pseudanabaenaceae cyanobacterium bins.68]|nr:LpxD N-terminal domain-containing protein [Pseudanabaenaceae cyanobacterium bins.68]